VNLLILTHDPMETLDRRILNEARLFAERGWTVRVILVSHAREHRPREIEANIILDPCPLASIEGVFDPRFHDSQAAQMREVVIRWFGRDTVAYRAARACHRTLRAVQLRWEGAAAPRSRASGAPIEQQLSQCQPADTDVLLDLWIRRQKPRHIQAVEVLYRTARRVYLAAKSAKSALTPRHRAGSVGSRNGTPSMEQASGGHEAQADEQSWYPLPFTLSFVRKALHRRADAIMACDLPALPAATLLANAWNVPLIYDSHEFYTEQSCFTRKQKGILEHHERVGLERAQLCFVVSDEIGAEMRERYRLERAPVVLYNAPQFQRRARPADIDEVRRRLGLRAHQRYLLYHGGIIAGRNLERVVRCFLDLNVPDTVLVMLGYGPALEQFQARAAASEARLIVHAAVPQDELVPWVSGASACVIPYLASEKAYEYALPNKLFDCIELSTPIIANERLVCVRRIVSAHAIGHVGPMESDVEMQRTLSDGLAWLKGGNGRTIAFQNARRRYGWEAHRETFCRSMHELGLPGF